RAIVSRAHVHAVSLDALRPDFDLYGQNFRRKYFGKFGDAIVLGFARLHFCAIHVESWRKKIFRVRRIIMNLKRYLSIYATLWKNSVAREMSFKGNFILWIFVELLWFGLQLSFVTVVYSQTDSVGTWTKWQ